MRAHQPGKMIQLMKGQLGGDQLGELAATVASVGSLKKLAALGRGAKDRQAHGFSAVHQAVQRNDLMHLKRLCRQSGSGLAKSDREGRTPAFVAADMDHVEALRMLIAFGADPTDPRRDGATPAWIAASKNHEGVLKLLVGHHSDVDIPNNDGQTPLWVAARNDCVECLHVLLDDRCSVHDADNMGRTPLFIAAACDSTRAMEVLIDSEWQGCGTILRGAIFGMP